MMERKIDVFAQIASQRLQEQRAILSAPQPPAIPGITLPSEPSDPGAAFSPGDKIDNAEKLAVELEKYRQQFTPFLQQIAPSLEEKTITSEIKDFDWRMQTPADLADFHTPLDGGGEWQPVHIPHYGGPIGAATAYYRTIFTVTPEMQAAGCLFIRFEGVDYKARVFINGAFAGSHEGFFSPFEFDVTRLAHTGENTLLVEVENDFICMGNASWSSRDEDGDKIYAATGLGWNDPQIGWHHCPPGMGIYHRVTIEARPTIHFHDLFIRPMPEEERAEAWVEVYNHGAVKDIGWIELSLYGQNFAETVFEAKRFDVPWMGKGLNFLRYTFAMPEALAWDLDTPWLYQAQVRLFDQNGCLLDTRARNFGMRSFTIHAPDERAGYVTGTAETAYGEYRLNGRSIRLRGANTMGFEQQDVLRKDWQQLIDDILLAKICNMNYLRLTQRPVQSEVYDFCDRLGLLTQTDLPLFGFLRHNQFSETIRQAEEMERLVRAHPCNIQVTYINEPFPHDFESRPVKAHRHLSRVDLERFFMAADQAVHLANPDRVIKAVDGDYDPPAVGLPDNHCYCGWYNGHGVDLGMLHKGYWQAVKPGWFYGCGEFGSEGLDFPDLMRRRYPASWLPATPEEEAAWTPNSIVMAQSGKYHYMWFDTQHTVGDWVSNSQTHQAWVTRLMTEAFRRDARLNSCAIHLFIDAWPSGWMKTIMDCERHPKPSYFTYRQALTPLMVHLRADRTGYFSGETAALEAWVCNDRVTAPKNAWLHYQMEVDGKVLFAQKAPASIPLCSSQCQGRIPFKLPGVNRRAQVTLRIGLVDEQGSLLNDSSLNLTVFPDKKPDAQTAVIYLIGSPDGKAEKLAHNMKIKVQKTLPAAFPDGSLFLIDDFAAYLKHEDSILQGVERGGRAVFLELPTGEYPLAGQTIKIVDCDMNPRHFVSRQTGHALIRDFEPEDFKFWFDEDAGYVTPLLATTFKAEGWQPILTSGNGGWEGNWYATLAAAEKAHGAGSLILCQLSLANRVNTNPVGRLFAQRMLQLNR